VYAPRRLRIARSIACPSCGAPLSLKPMQRQVICVYCNTSSQILEAHPTSEPRLLSQRVSKEDIERLKQLVLDGKRDEAIRLYATMTGLDHRGAETAVNDMLLSEYWRSMPINAFGFVLYFVLIGLGLGAVAFGVARANEERSYALLVPIGAAFAIWRAVRFVPKIVSTWVSTYGARGRARVAKRAVLRTFPDCVIVQVLFEVVPDSGGQPFMDEELLMVAPQSVAKLEPNNIVLVRYDEPKRRRVFPISPIEVVGVAGRGYR
jgi:uncharacterized Zn finger protein (UPF0148 family)